MANENENIEDPGNPTVDNSGDSVDLASYFSLEPEAPKVTGEPSTPTPTAPQTPTQPASNPLDQLQQRITKMNYGKLQMSEEDLEMLSRGDMSGLERSVTAMQQSTVMNTMQLIAPILQSLQSDMRKSMETQTRTALEQTQFKQKADGVFLKDVKYAEDPALSQFARMAYDKALELNKNDPQRAADMANKYITGMVSKMADTYGADKAPKSQGMTLDSKGMDDFLGR